MTNDVAIDNDVLIKSSCFDLLRELPKGPQAPGFLVLGAARFVVEHELAHDPSIRDSAIALSRFREFLETVTTLEPTPEEVEFATGLEEAAAAHDLPLDTGESQLCAIATLRGISLVLTGDKRAISAIQRMIAHIPSLSALKQRLACLEQLVLGVISKLGVAEVRDRICKEPSADKVMAICFSCGNQRLDGASAPDGLRSYISDLRKHAATVLCEVEAVFAD